MNAKIVFLVALLVAAPLSAHADIYKRELPDGTVIYTDEPHPDAQKITPPPLHVIEPAPTATRRDEPAADRNEQALPYSAVRITSPADDEVVWDDQGDVTVRVEVQPELQVEHGHRVVVMLNGETVTSPSAGTVFALDDIVRGTHVLQAAVRSREGDTLIASGKVTFHMKQHSILFRQNPNRAP